MILSDGRRIVPAAPNAVASPHRIVMHPDFRMIVLANRPGFPFLGNNLFAVLGKFELLKESVKFILHFVI